MHRLFATSIYQAPLRLPAKVSNELKRTSVKLTEIDGAGKKWSKKNYPNGYTSYGSLTRLHEQFSVFEQLKKKLDVDVARFAKTSEMKFETGSLQLSSLWVNVMPKDCYHAFHLHPLSVISGTYYVSVPQGTSPLRIEDPRASLMMAAPPRRSQIDLHAKNGDVILFESWLRHEVPPHQSEEARISVSFNYDWIGR
jgi:uncharacterized protein (TIGR02466 family)